MKNVLAEAPMFKKSELGTFPKTALIGGAIGLLLTLVAFFFMKPEVFFRSYLVGFMFWFNMGLGCLFWLLVQHLTTGHWGVMIRRTLEAGTRNIIWMALFFIPVILGMHSLYEWTHPEVVKNDPILLQKEAYLNTPFFLVRLGLYFAIWFALSYVLQKKSLLQDKTGDPTIPQYFRNISGPGIVLLFLTMTFASIDWILSLEPHFFSTMFGPVVIAGQALGSMAMVIAIMVLLARKTVFGKHLTAGHLHDLGKFMFAATMFWAYVNFSQFLIIWGANLAEEVPYYLRRMSGGWGLISISLIALHFFLPFTLMLNRDLKRNPNTLVKVAYWILFMRFLDLCYLILPSVTHHLYKGHLDVMGLAVAAVSVVGIGGIWLTLFFHHLEKQPLLPLQDPHLQEALDFRGGH